LSSWKKRRSSWGADATEQEYWLSYSDLMAGLLMIFALMLFAALHHYGRIIEEAGTVASTRLGIIKKLETIADSTGVSVDPLTGTVLFPDGVLFLEGQASLQPAGRAQLDRFAEKYFEVLLGDLETRYELHAIMIEGHTNDNGGYISNLDLSQRRAFAVMQHLLASAPGHDDALKQLVTASGRSFSQPVCEFDGRVHREYPCPMGEVDKERSRRIEVQFRLKDEELLERIRRLLLVR
jgi:chemotaxis protein MotB